MILVSVAMTTSKVNMKATSKNYLLARCRRYAQVLILEILLCIPAVKIFACLADALAWIV